MVEWRSRATTAVPRPELVLPGLLTSCSGGSGEALARERVGTNRWLVSVGPEAHAAAALVRRQASATPSQVLGSLPPDARGELVQLSVELDLCGAWITVANAGHCRPVVVRRAGWVDLRGHPGPPLGDGRAGYADDRVGLGPGDALVLIPGDLRRALPARPGAGTESAGDEALLDLLLALATRGGGPARSVADLLVAEYGATASGTVPVVSIAVPTELGDDRHGDLAVALGTTRDELELPGYPLGDLQPDLWSRPPTPPRILRFHLPPAMRKVKELRVLLGRMLASWRIAERVVAEDVALLATEIVTNAVRHGGTDAVVTLRYTGPTIEISVRDGSLAAPVVLPPDEARAGGRGMYLVDRMAAAWGTVPTDDGKVVWFEVPVAPTPHGG